VLLEIPQRITLVLINQINTSYIMKIISHV